MAVTVQCENKCEERVIQREEMFIPGFAEVRSVSYLPVCGLPEIVAVPLINT